MTLKVRGRSRSFENGADQYTTHYWSAILSITLSLTVFELFDVEVYLR